MPEEKTPTTPPENHQPENLVEKNPPEPTPPEITPDQHEEAHEALPESQVPPPEEEETHPDEEKHAEEETRDSIFEERDESEHGVEIDLSLTESSPLLLKVVSGPNSGAQFSMYPDSTYVIGSDPASSDIVFRDVSVSRQHAKVIISKDSSIIIEDLKSSNGTMVENTPILGKQPLNPNTLVSVGTSSFIIYDREGERETIISPLLPAIVKVLQQEEEKKAEEREKTLQEALRKVQEVQNQQRAVLEKQRLIQEEKPEAMLPLKEIEEKKERSPAFFLMSLGLLAILASIGLFFLFHSSEILPPQVNEEQEIQSILQPYLPATQYTFNKSSGRLLLLGHVLTRVDHDQLLHNLQALPFLQEISDNIIVDEYVWGEYNQIFTKDPDWKSVAIHSPAAGEYVVTGYIKTRKEADALNSYLAQNFPYLDRLNNQIVVEEDLNSEINSLLASSGFRDVVLRIDNGEVLLGGKIPSGAKKSLQVVVDQIKHIRGVSTVRNFTEEQAPQEEIIDISGKYPVSGSLMQPNGVINVVINGKILGKGDTFDGMIITQITPTVIYLELGGRKYKIEYNK